MTRPSHAGKVFIAERIKPNSTLCCMTPTGVMPTVMGVGGQAAVRLGNQPRLNGIGGLAVRPDDRVMLTSEAALLEASAS